MFMLFDEFIFKIKSMITSQVKKQSSQIYFGYLSISI